MPGAPGRWKGRGSSPELSSDLHVRADVSMCLGVYTHTSTIIIKFLKPCKKPNVHEV